MQATYAVNASPYLGTAADLSSLASTIPVLVTTEGWSIVGSYHHVWSEHWESNVMASYLALDTSTRSASIPPSARGATPANLIWKPVDDNSRSARRWVMSKARSIPAGRSDCSGA